MSEKKNVGHRLLMIQAVRIGFLFLVFILSQVLQGAQSKFLNPDVWVPIYYLLAIAFLLNTVFIIFFQKLKKVWFASAILFTYDQLLVTGLILYTGLNQSVFLFLYLVNIILCGLVFKKKGAISLALWTSIMFSLLLIFGEHSDFNNMHFVVGMNNIAFFAVAILSGVLSEQLDFMGGELEVRGRELNALRDLNQMIIQNIGTGLIIIDLEGKVNFTNKAAEKVLSDEKLESREVKDVFPNIYEEVQDEKNISVNNRYEVQYINSKKEKLIIEIIMSPLKDAEDLLRGYVLLFQDLTEVKRLEYAMRQQEKLAAVGQLAAGIAHEIRNPLASISGSVQLLSASDASSDEDKKLMNIVIREIDRLNNLISEFLDYVRPNQSLEDKVSIDSLLGEVVDMAALNQKLRQDVKVDTSFNVQTIMLGQLNKLKQAFLNIMINAYQAMEKSEAPVLSVKTWEDEKDIWVSIKDHGAGIEEATIKHIFEPFHTTKPKGSGLGLAVTHKIFENHSAFVMVDSAVGEGTEFKIGFPKVLETKDQ